ncbi:hypothetical protein ACO2Q9_04960 [Variovorax sp. VNK109]|uniref:hypothetical protein n=1 Tax=Variovorax sp. VNK109 TaxID=3400919 RepID=UPI003C0CB87A
MEGGKTRRFRAHRPESSVVPSKFRQLFTDAVVVALTSGWAYCIAFAYEAGFCSHFGVPLHLITPSLTALLTAAFAVLLGITAMLYAAAWPLALVPKSARRLRRKLFAFALLVVITLFWYRLELDGLIQIGVGAVILFGGYAYRLAVGKGTVKERLSSGSEKSFTDIDPMFGPVEKVWGSNVTGAFATIFFPVYVAWVVGMGVATNQSSFLMLDEHPAFALVRSYGDTLIAVKIDEDKKSIEGSVFISKIPAAPEVLKTTLKQTGKLKESP